MLLQKASAETVSKAGAEWNISQAMHAGEIRGFE